MTLKSDAKFEKKLTCSLENDMRNMANLKIGTLMGSIHPMLKMYELKIYRGAICHDNEE